MSQQILYVGPVEKAPEQFLWAAGLAAAHSQARVYGGAVALIEHDLEGPSHAPATWTLAFSIHRWAKHIAALAQAELDAENVHSPDLLECRTAIVLRADDISLRIDEWEFRQRYPTFAPETLLVGIVSEDQLVVVRHDWGADGFESFQAGLQSATSMSGVNYKAYRVWNDEELARAAGSAKVQRSEPGVVECAFFSLKRN